MEFVIEFNKATHELITLLEKKSRTEDEIAQLTMLKRRLFLAKSASSESVVIEEATPFFIKYNARILEPNEATREKFFMDMDIRAEAIKEGIEIKKEDEFIFALTDSIKSHYRKARPEEREIVYKQVKIMLIACTKYKLFLMKK